MASSAGVSPVLLGVLGAHRRIGCRGPAAPFLHRLRIQAASGGKGSGALLRRLELGSKTRRRAGAAVKNTSGGSNPLTPTNRVRAFPLWNASHRFGDATQFSFKSRRLPPKRGTPSPQSVAATLTPSWATRHAREKPHSLWMTELQSGARCAAPARALHVRMTRIYDGKKFMIWKLQAPCVTVTPKPAGGMP
jgi:hypothetical protein